MIFIQTTCCLARILSGMQKNTGTPLKTDMTIEQQPFEDVSRIKNIRYFIVMLVFWGVFIMNSY